MNPVDQVLLLIGFGTEVNCNIIRDEGGLDTFDYFVNLAESDIQDKDFGFSKSNASQGRINFGMRRVNDTLGIMRWEKDESRCSCTESLTGIYDTEE